jgi:hypothetical protein
MESGHPIIFDAPDDIKRAPAYGPRWHSEMDSLRRRVKPSPVLTAIFSMLVTGCLPNGTDWRVHDDEPYRLPFCKKSSSKDRSLYILCCGHVMTPNRAQKLVRAGLLDEGPIDRFNRPTLVITPAGREWLKMTWRDVYF